jgi:hypothetical protein
MTAMTQRSIILRYLQTYGTMTTLDARNQLSIMHPAARVQELREQGLSIATVRVHRIAKYVLGCKP